jgi:hypothetical protein
LVGLCLESCCSVTGRIWDSYGAPQHKLLRCEQKSQKLIYFN